MSEEKKKSHKKYYIAMAFFLLIGLLSYGISEFVYGGEGKTADLLELVSSLFGLGWGGSLWLFLNRLDDEKRERRPEENIYGTKYTDLEKILRSSYHIPFRLRHPKTHATDDLSIEYFEEWCRQALEEMKKNPDLEAVFYDSCNRIGEEGLLCIEALRTKETGYYGTEYADITERSFLSDLNKLFSEMTNMDRSWPIERNFDSYMKVVIKCISYDERAKKNNKTQINYYEG